MNKIISYQEYEYILQRFSCYYANKVVEYGKKLDIAKRNLKQKPNDIDLKRDFFQLLDEYNKYDTMLAFVRLLDDFYHDYDLYLSWKKTFQGEDYN